jgi:hypothetical protein
VPGPRYALQDRVADGDRWALWRGADLVLRRPVAVLIVDADHPHRAGVAAAAVRAGGIRHPGSVHVYDVAETEDGGLQVVREWVDARTLVDRLAHGPLEPDEACRIGAAVGRILGEAHRTGVTHGRLGPSDILVGEEGRVRVLGIAVAAALDGDSVDSDGSDQRRSADARDAAAVTYAAVTGRWPGQHQQSDVPRAPTSGGHPARARQVRAGVPAILDSALARLLETATDPDDAAEELEDLEGRLRDHRTAPIGGLVGLLGMDATDATEPSDPDAGERPQRGRLASRALAVSVALAVLAATVVTGAVLLRGERRAGAAAHRSSTGSSVTSGSTSRSTSRSSGASSSVPLGPVVIHGVKDFDPEGDGSEKPNEVGLAVDGDLSTAWQTLLYRQADLAPKHGVGLVLDLGTAQSVGAVRVDLLGTGTDLQVRSSMTRGAQPADYSPMGTARDAGRLVTVKADAPVRARYILVWLTRLPPASGGFRGGVAEVTVLRA